MLYFLHQADKTGVITLRRRYNLEKKTSMKNYFIDTLGSMALGLFSSLIVGLIL